MEDVFSHSSSEQTMNPLLSSLNSFINQQYFENIENESISNKMSNLASSNFF